MFKLKRIFGMNKLPPSVDIPFQDHLKTLDNVLAIAIDETSESYFTTNISIQCPTSNDIILFEVFFEFVKHDTRDTSKAGKEMMHARIYIGYMCEKKRYSKRGASKSDILKAYKRCVCDTYYAYSCPKSTDVFIHKLDQNLVLENKAYFDTEMFDFTVYGDGDDYEIIEETFKNKIRGLLNLNESYASIDIKTFTSIHNILLDDLKNRPNPDWNWTPEEYELGNGDIGHMDRILSICNLAKPFIERPPKSYHAILLKAK